jgi:hypothetical protein
MIIFAVKLSPTAVTRYHWPMLTGQKVLIVMIITDWLSKSIKLKSNLQKRTVTHTESWPKSEQEENNFHLFIHPLPSRLVMLHLNIIWKILEKKEYFRGKFNEKFQILFAFADLNYLSRNCGGARQNVNWIFFNDIQVTINLPCTQLCNHIEMKARSEEVAGEKWKFHSRDLEIISLNSNHPSLSLTAKCFLTSSQHTHTQCLIMRAHEGRREKKIILGYWRGRERKKC